MIHGAARRTVPRRTQRGMVLYISLLLLLALTLTGLAVSRNITVDERMAAVQHDHELAFQAAEAALREGEGLLGGAAAGDGVVSTGRYGSDAAINWQSADWTGTGTDPSLKTLPYQGALQPAPAYPPRFYLMRISQAAADEQSGDGVVYRVVAKGWGTNANDAVVLQSTFEVGSSGTGRRLSWRQLL